MVIRPIASAEASALSSVASVESPAGLGDVGDVGGIDGSSAGASAMDSFGSVLGSAVSQANQLDFVAGQKEQALASGAIDDLHGTMISVKEADIALKLVGTVRSKILDAFQELWRTSV